MAIKHLTGQIIESSGDFINIKVDITNDQDKGDIVVSSDKTYSGDMSNTFNNDTNQQRINLGAMGIKRKTEPNSIKCGESFVLFYYEPKSDENSNKKVLFEQIFGDRKIVVGVGIIQEKLESYETSSRVKKEDLRKKIEEEKKLAEFAKLEKQKMEQAKQEEEKKLAQLQKVNNNNASLKSYIHCYNNIDKKNGKITIFKFPFEQLQSNSSLLEEITNSLEVEEEDLGKFKGRSFPVNIFLIEKYITKMIESIQKIKLENLDISNDNKFSNYTDLLNWKTKIRTDFENMKDAGKLVLEEYLSIKIDGLEENESKNKLLKSYLRHYNFDSNDFELIPLDIKKELINELFKQKKEIKNIYSFEDFDKKVNVKIDELNTYYKSNEDKEKREKIMSAFDDIFPIINKKFKDKFLIDSDLYIRGQYKGIGIEKSEVLIEAFNSKYEKIIDNPYSILNDYFINTGSSRFLEAFINLDYGEKARHKVINSVAPVKDFETDNINRLISLIISILLEEAEKGDIWVDEIKIKYKLIEKLILLDNDVKDGFLDSFNNNQNFFEEKTEKNIKYYCLKELYARENLLYKTVDDLITTTSDERKEDLKEKIATIDHENEYYESHLALLKMQKLDFVFISGVAGSGKSYTLCEYLNDICKDINTIPNFLVVTPTGKAAHVLKNEIQSSNSNFECIKTYLNLNQNKITHIHNYLRSYYNPKTSFFDIPDNNIPEEIDILVIDEISMVDLILLTNLLKVVKPKKLIILGDIKQLPPINGYGNIARTLEKYLSNNNSIHLANMTKSHRATNATYIDLSLKLRDEKNEITLEKKNTNEWTFKIKDTVEKTESSIDLQNDNTLKVSTFQDEDSLIREIEKIYKKIFDKPDFKENLLHSAENQNLDKIQILTLRNNDGYTSSKSINHKLKDMTKNRYPLKYMRLKNIKEDDKFYTNGMIGSLGQENAYLKIIYHEDSEIIKTKDTLLSEFSPAYAFTVHKSQGSGFNNVILVLPKNSKGLTRELLYTALTRPKKEGLEVEGKLYILMEKGFELPKNLKFDKNRNMAIFDGQSDWCSDGETLSGIFNFNDKTFNRKPDLYIEMLVNFYCTAASLDYNRNYGVYEIKQLNKKEQLINLISSFSIINKRDALKILPKYNQDRSNENKVDFMEEDEEDSIITHNGLRTRSWSEAILMLIFDNLEIPYFYEVEIRRENNANTYKLTYPKPDNKDYRIPDFTISAEPINFTDENKKSPIVVNNVKCIIEHLGMLTNDSYLNKWKEKVADYYDEYNFKVIVPLSSLTKIGDGKYFVSEIWKINEDEPIKLENNTEISIEEQICFTTDEEDLKDIHKLINQLTLLKEFYSLK